MIHKPVLLKEVLEHLAPQPGENFVDCTINGGGHALAILKLIQPKGRLLGIDRDEEIIKNLESGIRNQESGNRIILVQGNFADLKEIIKKHSFKPVDGVLLDLGLSSWHLEESGRGFSFLRDEPLDMRFCSEEKPTKVGQKFYPTLVGKITAKEIVNEWPEDELVKIFREYGEERFARRIANQILRTRTVEPIKTTFELVDIIKRSIPPKYRYGRIHFATRIFQALRIAVNSELENLEKVLPQALDLLEKEGRLVVISFHSLEDRIVKNFLRAQAKEEHLKISTKKPVTPPEEEIKLNPRSRSAKLRAAIKI